MKKDELVINNWFYNHQLKGPRLNVFNVHDITLFFLFLSSVISSYKQTSNLLPAAISPVLLPLIVVARHCTLYPLMLESGIKMVRLMIIWQMTNLLWRIKSKTKSVVQNDSKSKIPGKEHIHYKACIPFHCILCLSELPALKVGTSTRQETLFHPTT